MRVIILGSGNGTNAKSILETQEHSMLGNAKIVGIFSNVPSSGILDVAKHYSIQTEVIPCKKIFGKLEEKEATLFTQKINEYSPDLIVLAGFPAAFIGILFTGSLFIEVIFSLDGLGLLGYEAVIMRDYPVIFATLYFFSLLGLIMGIISDFMYSIIDPRIDFEAR